LPSNAQGGIASQSCVDFVNFYVNDDKLHHDGPVLATSLTPTPENSALRPLQS